MVQEEGESPWWRSENMHNICQLSLLSVGAWFVTPQNNYNSKSKITGHHIANKILKKFDVL